MLLIAALTAMRLVYAGVLELRTDEAYYWTWSKESVLSFLDHPPGIAWSIRFGTAIFGDTNLGVRFGGIVAMLVTQLLLADIVRRVTHDVRAVVFAVLMPEAALYYGLLMAKVAPDTAMIPFAVAMLWALVRLHESGNPRWWLAAGLFAGLALLSKFTVIMLLPAVIAFVLVPDWRRRWLLSPYPWRAALIAVLVFSPVLIWNCAARLGRVPLPVRPRGRNPSIVVPHGRRIHRHAIRPRRLRAAAGGAVGRDADGVARLSHPRARRHPAVDRGAGAVLLFLLEVADAAGRRHLADVPVARRLCRYRHQSHPAAARGLAGLDRQIVLLVGEGGGRSPASPSLSPCFLYYVAAPWNLIGRTDPVGGEAGYQQVVARARDAVAADRRDLDRHLGLSHLRDAALVFQWPRAGHPDQRARQIPGLCAIPAWT